MARQLIEAIRNGDQALARNILLNDKGYGCGIDCQTAKRDGTALFWACAKGFVELVQLLIVKGANVNARTSYNSTPLIAAADSNRYHVVRLLIDNGADLNAQTSNGDTACHQAAYRGHVEAVRLLVSHGADVDIANTKFRTPYDEAARQGHLNLLPFLDGSEKLRQNRDPCKASTPSLQPATRSLLPKCGMTRVEPCKPPRRDSCDCLSHESLSRESSYEDCGQAAVLTAYDLNERLRDRELVLGGPDPERFFPSGQPALPPSAVSFPASTGLGFNHGVDLPFAADGGLSFTSSSLPFTYSGSVAGTNNLSLVSDKASSNGSSAKKDLISRLNIPA